MAPRSPNAMQAQVQQLIADLQRAEERCVLLEAEVREEVRRRAGQRVRELANAMKALE